MSVRLAIGASTDVGQVRTINQDAYLAEPTIVAVADGMGGHRGGEVAAKIAVETLDTSFEPLSLESLKSGLTAANDEILRRAAMDPELHGMGTTMCALAVVHHDGEDQVGIVNVGDSRVYRWAAGVLEQMTQDHSLVESMVREGRLTPAEAEVHPQRNIVTRALGASDVVEVDAFVLTAVDGHRYLLCSDGLSNELTDAEIAQTLGSVVDASGAAAALVAAANAKGGRDNITTVVVDVLIDDAAATGSGTEARPAGDTTASADTATSTGRASSNDSTASVTGEDVSPAASKPSVPADPGTVGMPAAADRVQEPPPAPKRRWWRRG